MTATVVVPTSVQKILDVTTGVYGTPLRIVEYLIAFTKSYQNDWVVAATYITKGTFMGVMGAYTIDSSGDGVQETNTYTAATTRITCTSTTVGTTYVKAMYYE